MNPFIFLAEQNDTLFFFYKEDEKPENNGHIVNLYAALKGMDIVKEEQTVVNIYCLFGDELSMFSLQNVKRGEFENFDKQNLEELYFYILASPKASKYICITANEDTYTSELSETIKPIDPSPKRELSEIQLVSINLDNI